MAWTKEQKAAYMREWRANHAEKVREAQKRYYEKNKDRINSRDRSEQRHAKHIKDMKSEAYRRKRVECASRWQAANGERIAARRSERWRMEPEYRARMYASNNARKWSLSKDEMDAVRLMYLEDCFYCGDAGGSVDHLVPKSRGGSDRLDNLVPCCRSCNSRKHDSTPEEFYLRRPLIDSEEVSSGECHVEQHHATGHRRQAVATS